MYPPFHIRFGFYGDNLESRGRIGENKNKRDHRIAPVVLFFLSSAVRMLNFPSLMIPLLPQLIYIVMFSGTIPGMRCLRI